MVFKRYYLGEIAMSNLQKYAKKSINSENLLSRQQYLIYQGNDLAKSFGSLTVFEHKILDYCFSFVQKNDDQGHIYTTDIKSIISYLKINTSGPNYNHVANGLKRLKEKDTIFIALNDENGRGIRMTSLFNNIDIYDHGTIKFSFNPQLAPYIFELKDNFYYFKLTELETVRSKYALILMKLWNAKSIGNLSSVTITGTLEEWESWLLGVDKEGNPIRWPAGRFKQKALDVGLKELAERFPSAIITPTIIKSGRKVVGYTVTIVPYQTSLKL